MHYNIKNCNQNNTGEVYLKLRGIMLACGLKEDLSGDFPCYSIGGNKIASVTCEGGFPVITFLYAKMFSGDKRLLTDTSELTEYAMSAKFCSEEEVECAEFDLIELIGKALDVQLISIAAN